MTRKEFKSTILTQHHAMYGVALSLTGNPNEAADLVQDTLLKLWDCRDSLPAIGNPAAYCISALRNRYFDSLRPIRESLMQESQPESASEAEVRRIDGRSDLSLVMEIIAALPPNQQTVIRMSSFGGCSNDEIARLTGLSSSNVRTLLSRGRKTIKSLFLKNS